MEKLKIELQSVEIDNVWYTRDEMSGYVSNSLDVFSIMIDAVPYTVCLDIQTTATGVTVGIDRDETSKLVTDVMVNVSYQTQGGLITPPRIDVNDLLTGELTTEQRAVAIDLLARSFDACSIADRVACLHAMRAPSHHPDSGKRFETLREVLECAHDSTLQILLSDFESNELLVGFIRQQG